MGSYNSGFGEAIFEKVIEVGSTAVKETKVNVVEAFEQLTGIEPKNLLSPQQAAEKSQQDRQMVDTRQASIHQELQRMRSSRHAEVSSWGIPNREKPRVSEEEASPALSSLDSPILAGSKNQSSNLSLSDAMLKTEHGRKKG